MSNQRLLQGETGEEGSEPTLLSASDSNESAEINRQPGSGSLDRAEGWVEENAMEPRNDGRSVTRTTFYAWDADTRGPSQRDRDPEDRRSWGELAKWNDGMWSPDRPIQNFDADVRRWVQTFCNQLDVPSYQYERVQYVIDTIDFDEVKQHRLPVEKLIVAAISLVVDAETDVDDAEEWDTDEWIIYDDEFESLMADVEMDREELWTARKIVHRESKYFDDT